MTYRMNGKIWKALGGADSVKLDWLDAPLPYTGAYIEGIRMVQHTGKRVRCQDLPLGSVWGGWPYCKTQAHGSTTRKQLNAYVRHGANLPRAP